MVIGMYVSKVSRSYDAAQITPSIPGLQAAFPFSDFGVLISGFWAVVFDFRRRNYSVLQV